MPERTVVHATLWHGPYLGNFMASEMVLARAVRERFDLGMHAVLGPGAAGQPWLADLDAAGVTWSLQPRSARGVAGHLASIARARNAALLHSHFTSVDVQAAWAAYRAGVPCLWHFHTGFIGYTPAQRFKDLLRMRLLARARVARVLAVTPWIAELACRRGVPAARVVMVPNGIVTSRFDALPDRAAARERLGIGADDRVVLGLGWWPEAKGADLMLDAIAGVQTPDERVTGLLVGEDALAALIDARGQRDADWLRRSAFVSDPAWLYAAADVFISGSRHEGFSYAVGEALASGLPVVMTDIPGVATYRGAPGVTSVAPGDAGALTAGLRAALAVPATDRQKTSARSRAWVRHAIGIDRWAQRICDVYAELL